MNAQVTQLEQLPMLEHANLPEMLVEARMGIILPPGKLGIIANLACLLAGITAVNINYTTTREQFEHMVKQAGLTRFITDTRFVNKQRQFSWPPSRDLIFLDQELAEQGPWRLKAWNTISKLRTPQQLMLHADVAATAPGAEAAVIFTGGTDDKPLGVPLTCRMLLAAALSLRSRLQLNPGHDILLSVLPAYMPAGLIAGILLPLLGGFDVVTNLHLPSSWAPRHIIPVKYIPTLPNGKLDYQTCFLGACRMLKIKPA